MISFPHRPLSRSQCDIRFSDSANSAKDVESYQVFTDTLAKLHIELVAQSRAAQRRHARLLILIGANMLLSLFLFAVLVVLGATNVI